MEQRTFGRLGRDVSVIGLGCWQLGADWGAVADEEAMAILHAAADSGVTCYDTADVYGDGRSERFVGRLLKERPGEDLFVATKTGRRAPAQTDDHYTECNLRSWVQRSLVNLGVDRLDLVQWHCPPTETIQRDSMYDLFDAMTQDGLIAGYGVSVETVEQALAAIARPQIKSVQIIANPFRLKPFESVMPTAAAAGVGVIVRVPLASDLLAAKYRADTVFGSDDHRTYNRDGASFDIGTTFSGVPLPARHRGGQRTGRVRAPRTVARPGRTPLDHRPAGGDDRHTRGDERRAGAAQDGRRGGRAGPGGVPGRGPANLRPGHRAPGPRPMVRSCDH